MKIVDTHQHLWDKDLFHYAWLEPLPDTRPFVSAKRLFGSALADWKSTKTVFVECDVDEAQVLDEASHVLRLANDARQSHRRRRGLRAARKGWIQGTISTKLAGHPKLKGIRRILHTHPDELGQGKMFIENVARLATYGLSFDLCVLARQLPVAINLASKCPDVSFVLDHCGVPDVKDQALDPWRAHIRELSGLPNVIL